MTPTILIVEDEGIVALSLKQNLETLRYEVVGISDSAAGAIAAVRAQRPSLVLMDIRLRGGPDGIDAAAEIAVRHGVPVVFITGSADDATLKRAADVAPFGCVLKPFTVVELRTAVELALKRHQYEERLQHTTRWLQLILRALSDAVVVFDRKARVTYLNDAAERLTGWTLGEALGRPATEVISLPAGEGGAPVLDVETVSKRAASRELPRGVELTRRDGHPVAVEGTLSPVLDGTDVAGVVLVLRPVAAPSRALA